MKFFISSVGCSSDEIAGSLFIEYVQPNELVEFVDLIDELIYNITVESPHSKVNQTVVQRVHELHTDFTKRFDETKSWCVNALGITAEVCMYVCACVRMRVLACTRAPLNNIN